MTATLPLDIVNKVERRWSARLKQAGSFQAEADRLKRTGATFIEGVQHAGDDPNRPDVPLAPPLPTED
jgi:hypothetical protein